MQVKEAKISKKVLRSIELKIYKRSGQVFAGKRLSIFKGTGSEYRSHRIYQIGDDTRYIDWKVTARARTPYVREYEQLAQIPVMIVLDTSSSMYFGHGNNFKYYKMIEAAGIIYKVLLSNEDKVGYVFRDDADYRIVLPSKGNTNFRRLLGAMQELPVVTNRNVDMGEMLEKTSKAFHVTGGIVIISDFLNEIKDFSATAAALRKLRVKGEVFCVQILDRYEMRLPDKGGTDLTDLESDAEASIEFSASTAARYNAVMKEKINELHLNFRKLGITSTIVYSDMEVIQGLRKIFKMK